MAVLEPQAQWSTEYISTSVLQCTVGWGILAILGHNRDGSYGLSHTYSVQACPCYLPIFFGSLLGMHQSSASGVVWQCLKADWLKTGSLSTESEDNAWITTAQLVVSDGPWGLCVCVCEFVSLCVCICACVPLTFRQMTAEVPQPSIEYSCRSPWKYLAYRREIGRPQPKPAYDRRRRKAVGLHIDIKHIDWTVPVNLFKLAQGYCQPAWTTSVEYEEVFALQL